MHSTQRRRWMSEPLVVATCCGTVIPCIPSGTACTRRNIHNDLVTRTEFMIMAPSERLNEGNQQPSTSSASGMRRPAGIGQATSSVMDTLRQQTTSRLAAQKDRAVEGLGSIT